MRNLDLKYWIPIFFLGTKLNQNVQHHDSFFFFFSKRIKMFNIQRTSLSLSLSLSLSFKKLKKKNFGFQILKILIPFGRKKK